MVNFARASMGTMAVGCGFYLAATFSTATRTQVETLFQVGILFLAASVVLAAIHVFAT